MPDAMGFVPDAPIRSRGSAIGCVGAGMIMADSAVSYKSELFYGDLLRIRVAVGDISRISFTIYYQLEKESEGRTIAVAYAQTGMVCYDYERKKVVSIPAEALKKISSK